jgi:hypothetical protein
MSEVLLEYIDDSEKDIEKYEEQGYIITDAKATLDYDLGVLEGKRTAVKTVKIVNTYSPKDRGDNYPATIHNHIKVIKSTTKGKNVRTSSRT